MTTPPTIVIDLAKKAKGNPIAWHEYEDRYVIVFEDGRKLSFNKAEIVEEKPKRSTLKAAEPEKKEPEKKDK